MSDPARLHFRDPSYDGQLARTVSLAPVHAADIGEAMATAHRLRKLTGISWYDEWSKTAVRAAGDGERALAAGDRISARRAFLRASEYYRQALYFIRTDLDAAPLQTAYDSHVQTFHAAIGLMDHHVEAVQIPYESETLTGYLHSPDDSGAVRPTVLSPCGYDSTAESGWMDVPAALDRGYNILVFEGPGQGGALYKQRLFFRPDFEHVLSPVLDWLLSRPEVDPDAVILFGRSFAGYLSPRAAAFEHRIAALVCDPAQPNMGARVPTGLVGKVAVPAVRAQMRVSQNRAEFFGARMATHGIDNIEDYLTELRRYDMLALAPQINCPTLIIEAEGDFAGGQGETLRSKLTAPAELVNLTAEQGAGGHCGGLGQQLWAGTVYPWLSRTLGSRRTDPSADADSRA